MLAHPSKQQGAAFGQSRSGTPSDQQVDMWPWQADGGKGGMTGQVNGGGGGGGW